MKLSDAEIISLLFDEQASDPATPATGFWRLFLKSTGLFIIDDAGVVTGPFGSSADLAAHLADAADAHDASAISYAGGTGMSATDVEAAIDELATEKANLSGGTFTGDISVPDEAYDATTWNGSVEVPTKNALRDKIETLSAGSGAAIGPSTVSAKTTTYTAADRDLLLCSASGGAWVLTLPAVTSGRWVTVKKTDATANAITVTPASGTIDGAATYVIDTQYVSRDFVSDGTNWFVV